MAEEKDSVTETDPMNFYEGMSSDKLADWLNQELKKSNQSLTTLMREKLISEDISGNVFKQLVERELQAMGFNIGCITTIKNIIAEVSKPPEMACSMAISSRLTDEHEPLPEGGAAACMPFETRLWKKNELTVELFTEDPLFPTDITVDNFFECANMWSKGDIKGETNYIPKFIKFEHTDEDSKPDVKVALNNQGIYKTFPIGFHMESKIDLDLLSYDTTYRRHNIVHEFGHVLGLAHEHQRSKFWVYINDYIDRGMMELDPRLAGRMDSYEYLANIDESESSQTYDPDSVMHYWFKKEWLKNGYSDEKKVDDDAHLHSDELHAVLKGVHKRQTLAQVPSSGDLKFLSKKYESIFQYGRAQPTPDPNGPGKREGPLPTEKLNGNKLIFYIMMALVIALVAVFMAIVIPFFLKEVTGAACHKMVEGNIPELAETIERYGNANDWCKYLHLTTCDHSGKNQILANLDVSTAYLGKQNPCWEDIVRVLCKNLEAEGPANDLAKKHNVDFDSLC